MKDQTKINASVGKKTVHLIISKKLLFHTFPRLLINVIFFSLTKKGAKTTPRVPKLGYFDWRVPKVSSQGDTPDVGGRRGLSYVHMLTSCLT